MSTPTQHTPALLPRFPLVADIQPNAGPAWVRMKLDDGTLLPVAEVFGPSDHKEAYTPLFAGSLDLHAELIECMDMLLSIACQSSDSLHENTRKAARSTALKANALLARIAGGKTS